jgi:hypothetical protein
LIVLLREKRGLLELHARRQAGGGVRRELGELRRRSAARDQQQRGCAYRTERVNGNTLV